MTFEWKLIKADLDYRETRKNKTSKNYLMNKEIHDLSVCVIELKHFNLLSNEPFNSDSEKKELIKMKKSNKKSLSYKEIFRTYRDIFNI